MPVRRGAPSPPTTPVLRATGRSGRQRLGERTLGAGDCERIRQDGWLAQPVNALTSTAYVAGAGVLAVRVLRTDTPERRGLIYARLVALVGVGSVLYHGPQPPGARLVHDVPIPAVILAAAASPLLARRAGRSVLPGSSRRRSLCLLGLATSAGVAYAGGRTGAPTCDPDSRLQLHGLWHVLSASALVTLGAILFLPGERI